MRVDLMPGAVVVNFTGQFGMNEARRVAEALATFEPVAEITLDYGDCREIEDAAFGPLAEALRARPHAHVVLRGLTRRQVRMLEYLGVAHLPPERYRDGGRAAEEPAAD